MLRTRQENAVQSLELPIRHSTPAGGESEAGMEEESAEAGVISEKKNDGEKLVLAVLGTRPFVLSEYVYVDVLGRLNAYFTFQAPLHSIIRGFMGITGLLLRAGENGITPKSPPANGHVHHVPPRPNIRATPPAFKPRPNNTCGEGWLRRNEYKRGTKEHPEKTSTLLGMYALSRGSLSLNEISVPSLKEMEAHNPRMIACLCHLVFTVFVIGLFCFFGTRITEKEGFSRESPVSPALSFRRRSTLTSITLIGSLDLAVKSRSNLFTHLIFMHLLTTVIELLVVWPADWIMVLWNASAGFVCMIHATSHYDTTPRIVRTAQELVTHVWKLIVGTKGNVQNALQQYEHMHQLAVALTPGCSEQVNDIAYTTNWILFSQAFKRALLMIMIRSQKPVYITAGMFGVLSFSTFAGVGSIAQLFYVIMHLKLMKTDRTLNR
ncbi:hypothetical protein PR048_000525 [Dryococelus australis]|uniref:Odorant receptor n=1 Tax=Dryococelus australis TaxID=614101 RepID=A0ABQ9IEW8_9NEOP|nr:hypothetical protein PR048_000525 [Dryococelus australis]